MSNVLLGIIIVLLIIDIAIKLRKTKANEKSSAPLEEPPRPSAQPVKETPRMANGGAMENSAQEEDTRPLTTMEEVKNTFEMKDFINAYQSGKLYVWLVKIGERNKAERLKRFNIPAQGKLSKQDKLKLIEVIYPNWYDFPGRLQQELDRDLSRNDDPEVSEDRRGTLASQLARYAKSAMSITVKENGLCLFCFKGDDDVIHKVCSMTKKEMAKLIHDNPQDRWGAAAYQFLSNEPFCDDDRDLGYVLSDLGEYIFNVVHFFYDTNAQQVCYGKKRENMCFSIMFNDSQPMTDPHMVTIDNPFDKKKNAAEVYPSYRFDVEQLQSLMGLSRMDIAARVLGWLKKAHLIQKENRL
ncbi:MAG: hypothetical protein IKZ46_17525 [Victivallales bacterium]|nr:hypothetical protein [Victivallales bacterium]